MPLVNVYVSVKNYDSIYAQGIEQKYLLNNGTFVLLLLKSHCFSKFFIYTWHADLVLQSSLCSQTIVRAILFSGHYRADSIAVPSSCDWQTSAQKMLEVSQLLIEFKIFMSLRFVLRHSVL